MADFHKEIPWSDFQISALASGVSGMHAMLPAGRRAAGGRATWRRRWPPGPRAIRPHPGRGAYRTPAAAPTALRPARAYRTPAAMAAPTAISTSPPINSLRSPVLAPSRLPSSRPIRERVTLTAPMTTAASSTFTW